MHCSPCVHALLHEPQCIESVCKLAHALLQFVSIGPESVVHVSTQVPFKQLGVDAGHRLPQPPQLFGSVFRLMQTFAQAASGEQFTPLSVMASVTGGPSLLASGGTVMSFGASRPGEPSSTLPSDSTLPSLVAPSTNTEPSISSSSRPSSLRPHPSTIIASTHVTKHEYKKKSRPNLFMTPHPPTKKLLKLSTNPSHGSRSFHISSPREPKMVQYKTSTAADSVTLAFGKRAL